MSELKITANVTFLVRFRGVVKCRSSRCYGSDETLESGRHQTAQARHLCVLQYVFYQQVIDINHINHLVLSQPARLGRLVSPEQAVGVARHFPGSLIPARPLPHFPYFHTPVAFERSLFMPSLLYHTN